MTNTVDRMMVRFTLKSFMAVSMFVFLLAVLGYMIYQLLTGQFPEENEVAASLFASFLSLFVVMFGMALRDWLFRGNNQPVTPP